MVNRTYADLARHYGTAILPARPYRPKDKSKVEVGVQVVGRWILARLRNRSFFSLAALNEAIRGLLVDLNDRTLRGWGRSRRQLFDEVDRPALLPLPNEPYEYAEWKRCRVNLDYHVEIAKHYYSVPHGLVRQEVEARITARTVEIFLRGKRVASHLRSTMPHRPTTVAEHMPTVERLRALGLTAMADALIELQNNPQAAEMPHADWLGLLIDREVTFRDNRRLSRRLAAAKLRQAATVEDVDYRTARGLDRALFQALTTSQWVREHNHLAIIGPTGTGKSWLACALGNKACRDGFSVLYKRASRLFADLAQARGEGRLPRLMTTLERTNLIIIDDWGPEPLTAEHRRDLLEIVDDRYDKGSLLITSQVPIAQWHDIIADPTLGDAILDRIVHNAHRIQLKGDSLRRRAGERKKA